jgi:CPA2 family monovalent cation:H+ antiporter-2
MLIGETEYRYQVEEDIKPFRDVLLGLFFVAIGMRLDVPQILASGPGGGHPAGALLASSWLVGGGLAPARQRAGHALRSGLWLCAGGEFGFVLILAHIRGDVPAAARNPAAGAGGAWCCRCCWRR